MAKCVHCQNELAFTGIRTKEYSDRSFAPILRRTILIHGWRDLLAAGPAVEFWKVSCPQCKKLMVLTRGDINFYYACCISAVLLPAAAVWFYINAQGNPVDLELLDFMVKFVVPGFFIILLFFGAGLFLTLNIWWKQLVRLQLFDEQGEYDREAARERGRRTMIIVLILVIIASEIYLRVRCHTSFLTRPWGSGYY